MIYLFFILYFWDILKYLLQFYRVTKILFWMPPICSTLRKITKSKKNFRPIWKNILGLPLKKWISKTIKPEIKSTILLNNSRTIKLSISSQKVIQFSSSSALLLSYVIYCNYLKSYRFVQSLYQDGIGKRHLL